MLWSFLRLQRDAVLFGQGGLVPTVARKSCLHLSIGKGLRLLWEFDVAGALAAGALFFVLVVEVRRQKEQWQSGLVGKGAATRQTFLNVFHENIAVAVVFGARLRSETVPQQRLSFARGALLIVATCILSGSQCWGAIQSLLEEERFSLPYYGIVSYFFFFLIGEK